MCVFTGVTSQRGPEGEEAELADGGDEKASAQEEGEEEAEGDGDEGDGDLEQDEDKAQAGGAEHKTEPDPSSAEDVEDPLSLLASIDVNSALFRCR